MQNEKELAAAVRAAMKKRSIKKEQLAKMLNISPVMVEKLFCGQVHPSSHLEKQMIEVLGIKEQRVAKLAQRRQQGTKAKAPSPRRRAA